MPARLLDKDTKFHVNATGGSSLGGPKADCGLTGRKIIVDTYGGWGRHGGGCFSGKDPTKVDRTASYMARYIAKNVVAAGLADCCEVQVSYAIGVAEPISVLVNTQGTAKISETKISQIVRELFPLTPKGMIEHLNLRRPIFAQTAYGGHFGRNLPDFTWEKTDMVEALKRPPASRPVSNSPNNPKARPAPGFFVCPRRLTTARGTTASSTCFGWQPKGAPWGWGLYVPAHKAKGLFGCHPPFFCKSRAAGESNMSAMAKIPRNRPWWNGFAGEMILRSTGSWSSMRPRLRPWRIVCSAGRGTWTMSSRKSSSRRSWD